MSNRAWVTLATNDSYGLGALVLAHSLRRAGTAYPAVVLVTPSVTEAMRNRLSAVFAEVITVDVLDSKDATHLALLQRPELGITFTKIHCWNLTQYQKCVFLDADTLIVQNCDELFDREELSAAPDVGWPDCFNSGVFVYVPSSDTYTRLITFAQERGSFDGGDQGLLNAFFSDWAHGDINKHLPFLYNVTSAAFYSYIPALKHYGQDLKIIHFIGSSKPWLQNFNWDTRTVDAPEHLRELLQLWWDLFASQVHSQLDTAMESAVDVEEPPLEPPPEDVHQIFHYEPRIDPESEFSWHHPEAENNETDIESQKIDMEKIYDPWKHYKGNIPSYTHSSHGGNHNEGEIAKYAWGYQETNNINIWQQPQHKELQEHQHYEHHKEQYHQHNQHQEEYQHYHEHEHQHYHEHEHQNNHQHENQQAQSTNWGDQHYQQHQHQHSQQHNWVGDSQGFNSHTHQNLGQSYQNHQYSQPDQNSTHWQVDQQSHTHLEQSKQYESHNNSHQSEPNHEQYNHQDHVKYHSQTHVVTRDHSQRHSEHKSDHHNDYSEYFNPFASQPKVEHIYHVHLDHRRHRTRRHRIVDRLHICTNEVNGHVSDSDSEDDFIIPRHPYDGFYLRHRATIDSRGRKICLHEIPPTPSPTPSLEEEPLFPASSPLLEEFETASECEEQYSGVAGNLARVVPGSAGYQREAIDELTRRQGWEAGNIDYMGADSFANIWAKISQTLNQQPPKEPSPPRKEPSPPKQTSPPKEDPKPETEPAAVSTEAAAPTPAPAQAPAPDAPTSETPTQVPTPEVPSSVPTQKSPTQATAPAILPGPVSETPTEPAPLKSAPVVPGEIPKTVEEVLTKEAPKEKTDKQGTVPPTPPATPKSTPEASTPVSEVPAEPLLVAQSATTATEAPKAAVDAPKAATEAPTVTAEVPKATTEESKVAVEAPKAVTETPKTTPETPKAVEPEVPKSPAPASEAPQLESTPEKPADSSLTTTSTDSPPLANTPSKEEVPAVPAAKSEERRKPAGKLQLSPPAVADPLPTPDSELEDAAALAHAIIASELAVSAPSPAATPASPPPPQDDQRLSVEAPEVPTPPVSLEQIGVKSKAKPTTAAQIESSVSEKSDPVAKPEPTKPEAPETPSTPPTPSEPSALGEGKKKSVKKGAKKEAGSSGDAPMPVPPPRKKEKKPKDK